MFIFSSLYRNSIISFILVLLLGITTLSESYAHTYTCDRYALINYVKDIRSGRMKERHIVKLRKLMRDPNIDINLQDDNGTTALMYSSKRCHSRVIKILAEDPNIDVNIQDNKGMTAFMYAIVRTENNRIVYVFANCFTDINFDLLNNKGKSVFDLANSAFIIHTIEQVFGVIAN